MNVNVKELEKLVELLKVYVVSNDKTRMKESSTLFLFSPERDNKDPSCQ